MNQQGQPHRLRGVSQHRSVLAEGQKEPAMAEGQWGQGDLVDPSYRHGMAVQAEKSTDLVRFLGGP